MAAIWDEFHLNHWIPYTQKHGYRHQDHFSMWPNTTLKGEIGVFSHIGGHIGKIKDGCHLGWIPFAPLDSLYLKTWV